VTALWIHEIADRFWADVGEAPPAYPRDLVTVVFWALPVRPVEIHDLRIDRMNAWLADRDSALRLTIPDRPLRACILVQDGNGILFVDATDADDERRFSVAHEIAHYLIEYAAPRQRARARLGAEILPVLDGRRAPSPDERIGALLGGISLAAHLHLMERTPDGHPAGHAVTAAERRADDLAFELLAPFDAVRARQPDGADRAAIEAVLRKTFGLPAAPAALYARRLAPEPPTGSVFRDLFSVR
jgi:hypothetical protein